MDRISVVLQAMLKCQLHAVQHALTVRDLRYPIWTSGQEGCGTSLESAVQAYLQSEKYSRHTKS